MSAQESLQDIKPETDMGGPWMINLTGSLGCHINFDFSSLVTYIAERSHLGQKKLKS